MLHATKSNNLHYRQKHTQHSSIALLKIEHVESKEEAQWYLGKKVAFFNHALTLPKVRPYSPHIEYNIFNLSLKGTRKFQRRAAALDTAIWGKIRKVHGNSGLVKAVFKKNLPPRAMGARVRVMLYPSFI